MKKLIVIIIIAIAGIIYQPAYSQVSDRVNPMAKGVWMMNAGIGAGTHFWANGYGFGPAIKLSAEKGMWELGPGTLTLGGEFGFSYFGYKYMPGWKETWANFIFAARSAYHYGWDVKGLDTYAGIPLGIGFSLYHDNFNGHGDHYGYRSHYPVFPFFGVFLGGSYFFNPMIGVNAEFGYNSTFANVGVVVRLMK